MGDSPTTVQRLPPELLVEIFKRLSPPYHLPRWPQYTSLDDPRRLSHVCSTWRTISLGIKSLWTSIPIKNEYWAGLSIDRSRPLPVSVIVTLDELHVDEKERRKVPIYDMHDGLQRALSEPHRLRALEAELATYSFGPTGIWLAHKLFVFLEAIEVPLLEYLDINLQVHDLVPGHPSFLGHLPLANLRYVSFRGLYQGDLPSPHILLAPLTTLELGCGAMWESTHDALESLSRLPTLEILSIRRDRDDMFWPGAIPTFGILDEVIKPRSVSLPNLKRLSLYESLELIAYLMRSLAMPTYTALDLHDANDQADEEPGASFSECWDVLAAGLNAHYTCNIQEGRPFRGLFLLPQTNDRNVEHPHRVHIVADYATDEEGTLTARRYLMTDRIERDIGVFPPTPQGRPLSISLCNEENFSVLGLVQALTGLPIFRQARAIIFFQKSWGRTPEPFSATSPSEWLTTTRYLSNIEVAHLGGYIAVHHVEALLDAENNGHASQGLCPTDLIIEDVSFLPEPSQSEDSRLACIPLDKFILALQRYSDADSFGRDARHLTHVELIYCDIEEDQVSLLRRELGDGFVSWDNLTRGSRRSRQLAEWYDITSGTEE
ncbi:hypothetical protein PENSPDRAFT_751784 [Peniophora sp. CONT]|nr:hypothetical protein PENSPDRAFT_751784 [Peniophora sp. CONT]